MPQKIDVLRVNDMLVAMEFGYLQCEKGRNLEMARINFLKTYFGIKKVK
jgi:hypothetical protein